MDNTKELYDKYMDAYHLADAIMNIRERRKIKKLAREKALSLLDTFMRTCSGMYACKRCVSIVADNIILELQKQVPCGNLQMNDHRIEFYNEVKRQTDKL